MKINLDEILQGKGSIAIAGHVRPDGDCVGSTMGLYHYLQEYYPQIRTDVYLECVPEVFRVLKGTEDILHEAPADKKYDLFISLDCGDKERLGFAQSLFDQAESTLCIDHHESNDAFADVNYIVPDISATAELIFHLLDPDKISKWTAEALYVGIAHDTGVFQYSNTSPDTMRAAALLMSKGINWSELIDKTYYEKTYIQNQILGRALLESMLILDGRCIVSVIRKRSMDFFRAKAEDLEGIVSQLRITKGVEVAIFLHEVQTNQYKVSLRSKGGVNVSKVAQFFGGGGHERAAGVTMGGSSHDVINNLTERIELQLDSHKEGAKAQE